MGRRRKYITEDDVILAKKENQRRYYRRKKEGIDNLIYNGVRIRNKLNRDDKPDGLTIEEEKIDNNNNSNIELKKRLNKCIEDFNKSINL
jgi:hypothetical protein